MAKSNEIYVCSECEGKHNSFQKSCDTCGAKFTLVPKTVDPSTLLSSGNNTNATKSNSGLKTSGAVTPTKNARTIKELKSTPIKRTATGISELDRVLGGGFVDAEVVLFSASPGSGKSTLSLRVAEKYASMNKKVLYSSGEESEHQIALRAKRMSISNDNIYITNETNLEVLLGHIEEIKPEFIIVDSLQTIASSDVSGSIGSISQSKEAANVLTRIAKTQNITMILINQVNKEGDFAGSEAVQHIVDATMMLESSDDSPLKFLRALKNRFGDTSEVGVFQHEATGLEEVLDPSGIFTEDNNNTNLPGSTCCMMTEGVRSIPVEVQALVTKSSASFPRRQFNGVDYNRAQIICAVVDKHSKAKIAAEDVYLTTLSGVKIKDPQADLAIAAALISSKTGSIVNRDSKVAFIGELGLTGFIRGGYMIENKIKEAERLGFNEIVIPKKKLDKSKLRDSKIVIHEISHVNELGKLFSVSA